MTRVFTIQYPDTYAAAMQQAIRSHESGIHMREALTGDQERVGRSIGHVAMFPIAGPGQEFVAGIRDEPSVPLKKLDDYQRLVESDKVLDGTLGFRPRLQVFVNTGQSSTRTVESGARAYAVMYEDPQDMDSVHDTANAILERAESGAGAERRRHRIHVLMQKLADQGRLGELFARLSGQVPDHRATGVA